MCPRRRALCVACVSLLVWCVSTVTEIKIGVVLISDRNLVYGYHRVAAAVDMAVDRVNRDILNSSYRLVTVMRWYGPACDGAEAPGKSTLIAINVFCSVNFGW